MSTKMRFINSMIDICKIFFRLLINLLGGILGIIVSVVIIGLNIYVSFNHTLLLFQSVGFTRDGFMDIAAVTAVELTFISSSIINVVNIKNRKPWRQRKVSIGVGVSGIALIMWSNIKASYIYGMDGVIIGAVIPLSIVAWEFILAEVYADQEVTPTMVEEAANEMTKNTVTEVQRTEKEQDETITHSSNNSNTELIIEPIEKSTQYNDQAPIEEVTTVIVEEIEPDHSVDINNKTEVNPAKPVTLSILENEAAIGSQDQTKIIKNLAAEITKNIPAKSQERRKAIEKTARLALRLYSKKGKKPTIAELTQKANCSQNVAKDVLKEVKLLKSKVS